MKEFYIYILANQKRVTLYIGVTSDVIKRIYQHKTNAVKSFTKKYSVHRLVHYEIYDTFDVAVQREKNLKKWKREWKIKLIEENNPNWKDLYTSIIAP